MFLNRLWRTLRERGGSCHIGTQLLNQRIWTGKSPLRTEPLLKVHFDGPSITVKRGLKTKDVRLAHPAAATERWLGADGNRSLVLAASDDRSPGVDAVGGKRHAGSHDVCRWKSQQATALIAPLDHTFYGVGAAE
jgi:hypothetical protein